jgi:hypothetical protein
VHPVGEHDQQARAAVDVRIAVEGDVQPFALTCVLDQGQHVGGAAGRVQALVEMGDVGGDARAAADLDRFAERVEEAVAESIAHVRVVDAAQLCRLL